PYLYTVPLDDALPILNPAKDREWIFKSTVDDSQVFARLADYFKKEGIQKVALLYDTSGFGQAAADELRASAAKLGIEATFEAFGDRKSTRLNSSHVKI